MAIRPIDTWAKGSLAARVVEKFPIPSSILLAVLVFTSHGIAQQYSFRAYGLEQGLTNLGIKSLHQDKLGFLWVSTEDGVFRYDGERFQSVGEKDGIPPTSGVAFGEAPDGSLLLGGDIGLFRRVRSHFERVRMPGAKTVSWYSGIQSDGRGTTWLATEAGLMAVTRGAGAALVFRLIPKHPSLETPKVYGLLAGADTVWYGCDTQLCRFQHGEVIVFGNKDGVPPSKWKSIKRAANGDLWAQGVAVAVLLPSGGSRFEVRESEFRSTGLTGMLSADSGGRIIFGTNDGLTIHEGASWNHVGRNSGLRGTVYCAMQDREGSLWIGLLGRGLVRWVGYREWEAFTTDSGLGSDIIYQILPGADGGVWAATENGLFRGARVHNAWTWRAQRQLDRVAVHSICPDGAGGLWLGTESRGAAHFDPLTGQITWFTETRGLNAKSPYALSLDRRNRIWAATEGGLFMGDLNGGVTGLQFRAVEQVPRIQMWSVAEAANGDIWVGSADGLFRLSGGNWSHFTAADGLSHRVVLALAPAKNGDLWVGYRYGGGLDHIRMNGRVPEVIRPANNPAGSSRTVYFLGFDQRQHLWAGTDRGVSVWDGGAWNQYDRRDGLVWDDCDLNGFAAAPDGSIWIGTSGGLARFTPQPETLRTFAPDVIYTKVLLGGKEVDPASHLSVDHSSNMLHAGFSAPLFARENSVLFRYRLAPLFEEWRETQQRELQFDGLPSNSYRLEVLARDGWGHWSEHPAQFSFQVLAPWWRSPWVLPVLFSLPVAIVILVSRLRGAAMRRRENTLVSLVEERTAELRHANEGLLQLSRIEHEKNLADEQRAHAEQIAQLNRRAIETLALAIEAKDQTTHAHLQRVETYAIQVGRQMRLDQAELEALGAAALLHDVGKLGVPDYIISKPGRLTPEEFEKMKTHTVVGAEIVEQIRFPYPVAPLVRSHHEKWDGTGYPDGLSGDQIPAGARILAAVDCLDALASDRQYRRAIRLDEAIEVIRGEAGKSFDPAVVEILARGYVQFERMAKNSCSIERTKLSTDLIIARGESPAAGFQTTSSTNSMNSDLASLAHSLEQANESKQALAALLRWLAACEDLAEIYAALRQSLRALVPYDAMVVYSRRDKTLIPETLDGERYRQFASIEIPIGTGLSGWVAENRKPSINGNPAVEPGYLNDPDRFSALRSALAVPLLFPETLELAGVLSLYRTESDAFSPENLEHLLAVSAAVADALMQVGDRVVTVQ